MRDKKTQTVELILQGYSTSQIAKKLGYSTNTIRKFYTELREEYEVDSKYKAALCYLFKKMLAVKKEFDNLISMLPQGIK